VIFQNSNRFFWKRFVIIHPRNHFLQFANFRCKECIAENIAITKDAIEDGKDASADQNELKNKKGEEHGK
jgi:hypothetical protein